MTSPAPSPGSPTPSAADTRKDRSLERALLANFAVHGAGMLAMALGLARMLPGGGEPDPAVRVAQIAAHPWWFRAGWLPWHLCAVVDLWLAVALVRARWIPKVPAVAINPSISNSLAYRRKRTIDCTSSGSLLVTGNGGKSEVTITRSRLVFLLESAAVLALASAARAVKANIRQVPTAIVTAFHLILVGFIKLQRAFS